MPAYSKEKQQELMAIIRQVLVLKPNASYDTIQKYMEEKRTPISKDYIGKLKKKIERERAQRYNSRTKEIVIAQFEDLVDTMGDILKRIAMDNQASTQMDKVAAIGQLVRQNKDLIAMMMDMGLLERYIGKITHEVSTADILKQIEEAKKNGKHNETNDRERKNGDSDKVAE